MGLGLTSRLLPQGSSLFLRQSFLAAPVRAALLGQGDAFALSLADQGALELGEGPTDSIELAIGESSPVKTRPSFKNSMRTPR